MTTQKFDLLTDDYVAERLAQEAKDCSTKYSAMGLEAYRTAKPTNKAKPNTRFLRTIIKETKNHNEALLAREAAESQARLRELREEQERQRRRTTAGPADIRKRQLGDIAAILSGGKKRKRRAEEEGQGAELSEDRQTKAAAKSRPRRTEEPCPKEDDGVEGPQRLRRHRSPPGVADEGRQAARDGQRDIKRPRSHREGRHRNSSPAGEERPSSRVARRIDERRREGRLQDTSDDNKDDEAKSDSDPLDDFIGPSLPSSSPIRRRGRGVQSSLSGIDRRFSATYDPKSDVEPDNLSAGGDWEEALEAFRDRQKWKQQGAERLRAAGFTEDQVEKWGKSGGERDVDDVRWAKRGEERAWDRSKRARANGEVVDGAMDDEVDGES